MHTFYFPTKTSWISSGSNLTTGVTQTDQNFGQDEILELKKFYYNNSLNHVTRTLVQFDISTISKSIVDGDIPEVNNNHPQSASVFLKLYEAEGNSDLSTEYKLAAFPISESWDEGRGKSTDVPKVTDGVSWKYASNKTGASSVTWNNISTADSGTISYLSGSTETSTQTFSYESPDINMDISNIVGLWITGSLTNNGILLRFSGSQELDTQTFGNLKFFSSNTNTIYAPKLEVIWDNHLTSSYETITGSGTITELDVTGSADNYLYMRGLKESYKENDKVKFRVGARKRYIQKTFNTSVQTTSGSYVPDSSGSYAIKDVATDEFIVPFSAHTSMSYDTTSNYFVQWLSGFHPDRVYKILLKLKMDDGQEQIFDDNFEFKVKR